MGTPYSWGDERADGMDCSSTVRAFFACFGLSLPRNAEAQRQCGELLAAMGQAMTFVKQMGFTKAVAQVRTDNIASIALHKKLGALNGV